MDNIIVVASRNRGKLVEIEHMLELESWELVTLDAFPQVGEIPEEGETFEENAVQKARTVMEATGVIAMADDSGIVVDALGGKPGVCSARFAGEDATDEANNRKLLDMLKDVPAGERTARFVCAICVIAPDGRQLMAWGECEGLVTTEERGDKGFGYDPLFYYPPMDMTFGQMTPAEKNGVSHRSLALSMLRRKLPGFLGK